MNLEDDVSRLRLDVARLTRSNQRMEKTLADQNEMLARVVNVLDIKFDKQSTNVRAPPPEDLMFFSDSQKRWRKDFSLNEMFSATSPISVMKVMNLRRTTARTNCLVRKHPSKASTKDLKRLLR